MYRAQRSEIFKTIAEWKFSHPIILGVCSAVKAMRYNKNNFFILLFFHISFVCGGIFINMHACSLAAACRKWKILSDTRCHILWHGKLLLLLICLCFFCVCLNMHGVCVMKILNLTMIYGGSWKWKLEQKNFLSGIGLTEGSE